jgi:hypothetical protein
VHIHEAWQQGVVAQIDHDLIVRRIDKARRHGRDTVAIDYNRDVSHNYATRDVNQAAGMDSRLPGLDWPDRDCEENQNSADGSWHGSILGDWFCLAGERAAILRTATHEVREFTPQRR